MKTNPFGSSEKKEDEPMAKGPEAVHTFFHALARQAKRLPAPMKVADSG